MDIINNSVLINKRVSNTNDSTLGILYLDNEPIGFVIEDEPRDKKIRGETRISEGTYKLALRKQETPLTIKYRNKFPWFKYHIELSNVPNFTGIYIHIGNFESNTDGCQIIGRKAGITSDGEFRNYESTSLYIELYSHLLEALEKGHNVYYKIIDND